MLSKTTYNEYLFTKLAWNAVAGRKDTMAGIKLPPETYLLADERAVGEYAKASLPGIASGLLISHRTGLPSATTRQVLSDLPGLAAGSAVGSLLLASIADKKEQEAAIHLGGLLGGTAAGYYQYRDKVSSYTPREIIESQNRQIDLLHSAGLLSTDSEGRDRAGSSVSEFRGLPTMNSAILKDKLVKGGMKLFKSKEIVDPRYLSLFDPSNYLTPSRVARGGLLLGTLAGAHSSEDPLLLAGLKAGSGSLLGAVVGANLGDAYDSSVRAFYDLKKPTISRRANKDSQLRWRRALGAGAGALTGGYYAGKYL